MRTIFYCYRHPTLPYEGLTVCCLVVLNFILVVSDNKLRHEEIPYRVRVLLDQLEGTYSNIIYYILNFSAILFSIFQWQRIILNGILKIIHIYAVHCPPV